MTGRLLIFGCTGQVGRELVGLDPPRGLGITGLSHREADITREDDVRAAIRQADCAIVVNAAAYTHVDRAESEPEKAFRTNRDGPPVLGEACRSAGVPLVHLSTDYVFDGTKDTSYVEDDPVNPLGVYGASKEAGERALRGILRENVILRTSWVYSAQGHNFVKTMLQLSSERNELSVVDDQIGCPTAARDIAEAVVEMTRQIILEKHRNGWGTFHYRGSRPMTWYGFACAIFEITGRLPGRLAPKLHPISTGEYPTPARRPANSVLNCSRVGRVYGIHPRPFAHSLSQVIEELRAGADADAVGSMI